MKLSLLAFGVLILAASVHAHRTSDAYALLPATNAGQIAYIAAKTTANPCKSPGGVGTITAGDPKVFKGKGVDGADVIYTTAKERDLYVALVNAIIKVKGHTLLEHAIIRDFQQAAVHANEDATKANAMRAIAGCKSLMHDATARLVMIQEPKAATASSANGLKHPGLSVLAAATLVGLAHTAQQF